MAVCFGNTMSDVYQGGVWLFAEVMFTGVGLCAVMHLSRMTVSVQ